MTTSGFAVTATLMGGGCPDVAGVKLVAGVERLSN